MAKETKTIRLASGGALSLTVEIELFALNAADREVIFDLIDSLNEYEQRAAKPLAPAAERL